MMSGELEVRGRGETGARGGAPLEGLTVVVTRPRAQADAMVRPLEELGARAIVFPTIRIAPPEDPEPLLEAARNAGAFDWIVFTSVNGVEAFAEALASEGVAAEEVTGGPGGTRICAIGPATGAAAAGAGLPPDLIPDEYVAEAVVDAMAGAADLRSARVVLPRASIARSALPRGLRERGARIEVVAAYRTVPVAENAEALLRLLRAGAVDLVTFTASSTVRSFHEALGGELGEARAAAIGPITAGTARELGYEVAVVAREYTIPGLVEACVRWAKGREGE